MRYTKIAFVCVIIIFSMLTASGMVSRTSKVSDKVIYYEKVVALTFDDGPSRLYTNELLDGLKERGVRATFFLVGENIEGNEEIVKRMYDEGHLIGNHTYSHVKLVGMSDDAIISEISRTNEAISRITGEEVTFIRPPYGIIDERVLWDVSLTPILWSYDTNDWCSQNADCIVKNVVKNVKSGDIIIMHDVYKTSVSAALRIVDELQAMGYVFVTADELIIE